MNCKPNPKVTWLPEGWKSCTNCGTQWFGEDIQCFARKEEVTSNIPDFEPDNRYDPFPSYEEFRAGKGQPVRHLTVDEELNEFDVMRLSKKI